VLKTKKPPKWRFVVLVHPPDYSGYPALALTGQLKLFKNVPDVFVEQRALIGQSA
tara:strand:- start:7500 stop:7664 length:165 start_codon:yes stop_codon:yes gene_type:complete